MYYANIIGIIYQVSFFVVIVMKRLALVTGGVRGIGRDISIALKNAGFDVAATYCRNKEEADAFGSKFGIKTFAWDVSDFDACKNGVSQVKECFNTDISILVNNAGITSDRMMHKMEFQAWDSVIKTNLYSVFNMCRAVISDMRNNGYGRIVNISSVNGLKGQVGQTNYSAAKAGIIGFSKALALESADKGITVNAIAPGYVDTQMTKAIKEEIRRKITETIPVKRFAKTEEIADAVLFLINQPYVTGETLNINGGQYMS